MTKKFTVIYAILFLIISVACEQKAEKKSDLQFTVNENLLGLTYQDTTVNLILRIPKGWLSLESFDSVTQEKFKVLQTGANQQAIFIDSLQQGGSVIITHLPQLDTTSIGKMYQNPDSTFNQQKAWNQILKSSFFHNDLMIKQFLLQNNEFVSFRLIISEGLAYPVQIDYILSRSTYMQEVKKIESSIGSINSL